MVLKQRLAERLHTVIASVCPIDGLGVNNVEEKSVRIDFTAEATQGQRDAANAALASFDWSDAAQNVWETSVLRLRAKAAMDTGGIDFGVFIRAAILVIMDEINILRANPTTTYAPRNATQLRAAIRAKIDSGDADM